MAPRLAVAILIALAVQTSGCEDRGGGGSSSAQITFTAAGQLGASLRAAEAHDHHIWRDTPPFNADHTLNVVVEIPAGSLEKREFDMAANAPVLDRILPASLVGYPINYGFVPQTVSYDGDPFDGLVLGPPVSSGVLTRGIIVGLMHMSDEKGSDAKVIVSPVDDAGAPLHALNDDERQRLDAWFSHYKDWEAADGKWSDVTGWGDAADGRAFVERMHAFFRAGRHNSGR